MGHFPVSSGTLKVVLSDNANGYVIADALRVAIPVDNPVNGVLGFVDNDPSPNLAITYEGANTYQVVDHGTGGPLTYLFTGVTSLGVTMGGTQDTLERQRETRRTGNRLPHTRLRLHRP